MEPMGSIRNEMNDAAQKVTLSSRCGSNACIGIVRRESSLSEVSYAIADHYDGGILAEFSISAAGLQSFIQHVKNGSLASPE